MVDAGKREIVRQRAGQQCEYCHVPELAFRLSFHVEHIVARVHGGSDAIDNLAWACPRCNYHKGPNLATVDPQSREQVNLFDPRVDTWDQHFEFKDYVVIGISPTGRGTARLLQMNDEIRVAVRKKVM